jgi:hypothetical protein
MSERQAEQIVLASRPNGAPTPENFRLEKVAMPTLPSRRRPCACPLSVPRSLYARPHERR